MNIKPIPWLCVGAFVRERETDEVYQVTDCPETISLRDIGGEEIEIQHVKAYRHMYLTEFLRGFQPVPKPPDWIEIPEEPPYTGPTVVIRGWEGPVTTQQGAPL